MTRAAAVIAVLATLASAVCLRAQAGGTEVRPGSREVDASRVAARTDSFGVVLLDSGEELPAASLELRTWRVTAGGVPVLARRERMAAPDGDALSVDSFVVAAATLAPVYLRHRDLDRGIEDSLSFDGLTVRGMRSGAGRRRPVSMLLAAPVFLGNSVDLMLSALPLALGRAFYWKTLGEGSSTVETTKAAVLGEERVRTLTGGSCAAWRVEVRSAGLEGGMYWVEKESGELLQFQSGELRFRILRHRACPPQAEGTRAS